MNRNFWILIAVLAGVLLSGCAAPEPKTDPRDAGLKDPMNYNPTGNERRSVSGGGILDYDRKEMGKDVNSVLNP
jgi:hypothetical protein